jgi:hypothetical protein
MHTPDYSMACCIIQRRHDMATDRGGLCSWSMGLGLGLRFWCSSSLFVLLSQSEVEYEYFADRFSVRCQHVFQEVCILTLHAKSKRFSTGP